jgi:hypothetical protein
MRCTIRKFQDWPQDETTAVKTEVIQKCRYNRISSYLLLISKFWHASLRNVSTCCALCNFHSFRKWQTSRNSVHTSSFASDLANHSRNLGDIKTLQRRNNEHLIGSKVE